ncbi:MAG TPA: heparinase II/III family protein, partial [Rhizomicrobium sp.]
MDRSWYLKRLRAMGPGEIARRSGDKLQELIWRRRYFVRRAQPEPAPTDRIVAGGLSRMRAGDAPAAASANLVQFADRLLGGEWPTFAVDRSDVTGDVDWHLDPASGKHAPAKTYAFDIPFVGGAAQFDTKYVWELSRHHQTTVLAMAFWLTGDDRYARAAVAQVQSWIRANPFLHGIHWSSGIELGLRLIAFTWTRRLLDGWPPVRNHFEEHEEFSRCVFLHQWVLAHRHSHGSSANNHLLYEMAGLFISCCAMPWHENAVNWRKHAATILELEFPRQVFPSGYTRELASDYNGFVLEGLLLCLAETRLSGCDLAPRLTECARRMSQWLAEYSDCGGHPPRQGDSDDASGFLLDAPEYDRWRDVADWSGKWFGLSSSAGVSLRAYLFAPLSPAPNLPAAMSDHVATGSDSGLSILRARRGTDDEIYCVFDAGPLGYLSTAAHGHADAL